MGQTVAELARLKLMSRGRRRAMVDRETPLRTRTTCMLMLGALAGIVLVLSPLSPVRHATRDVVSASVAFAAPTAVELSDLAFSEDVDNKGRPRDPKVEFDKSTEDVWVSFDYHDFHGSKVSFLARANGEDWSWGDLDDCCDGSDGRYAFPLKRRSGKNLGGAAYDVFIYADDAEKAHGGFGVRGTKGFDSDDQHDGNDNN